MTRKTTWTNDSLVKGFGPNYPERQAGGVHKKVGTLEEARLHVTWESDFGESGATPAGAYIQLPRMAIVREALFIVDVAWAGGTSLSVGHTEADTADVDAFFAASELATADMTPAGLVIVPILGAYFASAGALLLPIPITDDFDDATIGAQVFITSVGTWTAGEATLVLTYTVAQ